MRTKNKMSSPQDVVSPPDAGTPPDTGNPPDYAPYDAEFFIKSDGTVVSHDDHLNTDGEALYRFLLSQSLQAPYYQVHCRGTHTETRYRYVTRQTSNGLTETVQESYTETVTDFDFLIDVYPSLPTSTGLHSGSCGPVHWSVADSEPAYRGRMVREVEQPSTGVRSPAESAETKEYRAWRSERTIQGLPPWMSSAHDAPSLGVSEIVALKSSKTLRQWADEYCASPKHLKEFMYEKVLYGWNIGQLEQAIRTTISSTPYNGNIEVHFNIKNSKIYIRPHGRLSRMLSNIWLKILLIVLLIYPFIWLYKRFHGGGRWEVCGGAYGLKRAVPIGDGLPSYSSEQPSKMVGVREGEWFRNWEGIIRRSVIGRYQSSIPISSPGNEENRGSLFGYLDGY